MEPDSVLAMGKSWMDWDTLEEQASIELTFEGIKALIESGEDSKNLLKEKLSGIYCYAPRPSRDEITGLEADEANGQWSIKLRIRRGQYALSEFLLRHTRVMSLLEDGRISMKCLDCGQTISADMAKIPRLPFLVTGTCTAEK